MSMMQPIHASPSPAAPAAAVLMKTDRLRRSLEAMLRSNRNLTVLGRNRTVVELASQLGLGDHDYCQFEIVIDRRHLCLVCIPQSHWNCPDAMERFEEVRIAAGSLGHKVVLAPESLVRKAQLLGTGQRPASMEYDISGGDRTAILHFLLENGSGTLAQLAGLMRHPDPVGAVLHLAVTGAVDIDLDAVIAPATQVRFPVY